MSSNQASAQQKISDLKVSGSLMTLQTGLFCVYSTPGQQPPSASGLPGVRISQPPVKNTANVEILTFDSEGWMSTVNGAALIRVHQGPAQVMVTIYQEDGSPHEAPRLQVVQLSAQSDASAAPLVASAATKGQAAKGAVVSQEAEASVKQDEVEIGAHIQRRGDVAARLGEWMGKPGSRAWIEGFGVAPASLIAPADIEYQAVLGKGWLSPWVAGGQYCGSRGMALPILGLRVRLKGQAAKKFECRITATFTDGTEIGPVSGDEPVEAASLAPLEAFLLEIIPRGSAGKKAKSLKASAKAKAEAEAELAVLLDEEDGDIFEADDFDLFIEEEGDSPVTEVIEEEEIITPKKRKTSARKAKAVAVKAVAVKAVPAVPARRGRPAAPKAEKPVSVPRKTTRGRKPASRR
ncbi:hypothetical protein HK11_02485 [Acetobacter sp. DmW_043]|nr:hypothetical protein HK11_02485 [Acetobacter sp. DmW_043]